MLCTNRAAKQNAGAINFNKDEETQNEKDVNAKNTSVFNQLASLAFRAASPGQIEILQSETG